MATPTDLGISPESITPEFQDKAPLLDLLLPPLTPEQEAEVDKMMTETPEYQKIQEDCRTLKAQALEAAVTATRLLEALREGTIPEENLEMVGEVILSASQTALAGRNALDQISQSMEEAGLPPGECKVGNSSNTQTAPQTLGR